MSVIGSNIMAGASGQNGYQISRSIRTRSSASAYFNRTFGTPTNNSIWTLSCWIKRGQAGVSGAIIGTTDDDTAAGNVASIRFTTANKLEYFEYASGYAVHLVTSAAFVDTSSFFHLAVCVDVTQATASNRVKIYVNGVQLTAFSTSTYPQLNQTLFINKNAQPTYLAAYSNIASGVFSFFDGYLTEINFVDGQALTPSSFGEIGTYGVWSPKRYTGTYGTNGFYLNFSDNSAATSTTIGKDYSGNSNNWTPNNISVTAGVTYDSMIDVPTRFDDGNSGRGNYATLNPVSQFTTTLTNGNLTYTTGTSANPVIGSFELPTSGKWYWEVTVSSVAESMIGIQASTNLAYAGPKTVYYRQGGASNSIFIEGTVQSYNAVSYTNGDIVAVAYNAASSQISWYKNNVQQGGPFTLTSLSNLVPIVIQASGGGSTSGDINFGQRPFSYTPPTGFKALNTQNISNGSVTTSGSFTGNLSTAGPVVWLNGVPTAMTINGNAVTFGTHADRLASGFKVRSSSSSYNNSGSNTYSITTTGAVFKFANAQVNP